MAPPTQLLQLLEEHVSRPSFLAELEAARAAALTGDAPEPPSSPGTALPAGEGLQADWWEVRSDGEFASGGRGRNVGGEWSRRRETPRTCRVWGGTRTAGTCLSASVVQEASSVLACCVQLQRWRRRRPTPRTRLHDAVSECTGDYVVIEHSDVILAFSYFIAAYVVTLPEATSSDTRQLQAALAQTMQVCGNGEHGWG